MVRQSFIQGVTGLPVSIMARIHLSVHKYHGVVPPALQTVAWGWTTCHRYDDTESFHRPYKHLCSAESVPGSYCFSASPRTVDPFKKVQSCSLPYYPTKRCRSILTLRSIFRAPWQQWQRGRESVRSSCAGGTPERGGSSGPEPFLGHTVRAGGLLRSGRWTVVPGPCQLTCLFLVFITISVGRQHKRENSGKTNAFW